MAVQKPSRGRSRRAMLLLGIGAATMLLSANSVLAGKPATAHVTPTAVDPYPSDSSRPTGTHAGANAGSGAATSTNAGAQKPGPSTTLGVPVSASLEIARGARIG